MSSAKSTNDEARIAREFHDATTHTPQSVRTSGHTLEWDIKPFPFKVYTDIPAIALPRSFQPVSADTFAALGAAEFPPAARLTLERLAALLYYSAGVTKKKLDHASVLQAAAGSAEAVHDLVTAIVPQIVEARS